MFLYTGIKGGNESLDWGVITTNSPVVGWVTGYWFHLLHGVMILSIPESAGPNNYIKLGIKSMFFLTLLVLRVYFWCHLALFISFKIYHMSIVTTYCCHYLTHHSVSHTTLLGLRPHRHKYLVLFVALQWRIEWHLTLLSRTTVASNMCYIQSIWHRPRDSILSPYSIADLGGTLLGRFATRSDWMKGVPMTWMKEVPITWMRFSILRNQWELALCYVISIILQTSTAVPGERETQIIYMYKHYLNSYYNISPWQHKQEQWKLVLLIHSRRPMEFSTISPLMCPFSGGFSWVSKTLWS